MRKSWVQEIDDEQLDLLIEKVRREHAVDFRGYKYASLSRRIKRRLNTIKCPDMEGYLQYLDSEPGEYAKLVDSILINVTDFFRDAEAWNALRQKVIPRILERKSPGDRIRVWCAGCASGEEAYTFAMLLLKELGNDVFDHEIRVYATDIDEDALTTARFGKYSNEKVKSIPDDLLRKYFTHNSDWIVNRDLRKIVIFGHHNLITAPAISHVDLIICRNVLIYMSPGLQYRVLTKFHFSLEQDGFLFLGRAESLFKASCLFHAVDERWRIFEKAAVTDRLHPFISPVTSSTQ